MIRNNVIFATEGKGSETIKKFGASLYQVDNR
jgi:hypothetical protein